VFVVLKESPFTQQSGISPELQRTKLYENDRISIIEVHCDNKTRKDGLYVIHPERQQYFNWFDPGFNTWAVE